MMGDKLKEASLLCFSASLFVFLPATALTLSHYPHYSLCVGERLARKSLEKV